MAPFRSHEPDKRENGSESEPKIKYFREKRIKIGFSRDLPLEGGEKIIFPFRTKKSAKNIEEENSEAGTTFDLSQ